MKFEYDTPEEDKGPVVAELFHMVFEPTEVCLNIHNNNGGVVTTLYYDGEVVVQDAFDTGAESIKKFYKGDKITITF